jgi:hypothetical protein
LSKILVFFGGVLKKYFQISKSPFRPIIPVLHHSITPIINNALWTTDDPIDKETQLKAVHSIRK